MKTSEQYLPTIWRLASLLRVAKCPACGGDGAIGHEVGGCDMDGENDTRDVVWEECQWCSERKDAMKEADAMKPPEGGKA